MALSVKKPHHQGSARFKWADDGRPDDDDGGDVPVRHEGGERQKRERQKGERQKRERQKGERRKDWYQ